MAFYQDEEEDELEFSEPGVQTGPESGVISGQGSPNASAANAPDNPGNFVGIKQYLDANKSQAAKLGDQASGIINQSANEARSGVQTLNQEAQEKVVPQASLGQDILSKIQNNAESLSQQERDQVKKTSSAEYKGPKTAMELNSYQPAAQATQRATQNIDNSGTEQGRMGLVSQINNKPRTQGMNVFDNALLQAGGGREKLAQASSANQDVKGGLDAASQAIGTQIGRVDDPNTEADESSGAMGDTAKARAGSLKSVEDALSAWKSGFQPKVDMARQSLIDQQNRITGDLGDNQYQLSDESLNMFGLNPGDNIYGLNLNDYLSQASPNDVTSANVADQTDYARYAALADLAGDSSNFLDQANVGQAGMVPSASADKTKLRSDMTAAAETFEKNYRGRPAAQLFPSVADVIGQSGVLNGKTMEQIENQLKSWYEGGLPDHTGYYYDQLMPLIVQWKNDNFVKNEINPLPKNPDGSTNWSGVQTPTGAAGKQPSSEFPENMPTKKKKG